MNTWPNHLTQAAHDANDGPQEESGRYGPYFVYERGHLYSIPCECVVRDHDYATLIEEPEFRDLANNGWCAEFEAAALLCKRAAKSRSIIVVCSTPIGSEVHGELLEYFWCVRFHVGVGASSFGRHIIWPIIPERASQAHEHWMTQPNFEGSRLTFRYVPSPRHMKASLIPACVAVDVDDRDSALDRGTYAMLCAVRPTDQARLSHTIEPMRPLDPFNEGADLNRPAHELFKSSVVSTAMQKRASRCMRFSIQEAPVHAWNLLSGDLEEQIFSLIIDACIDSHGGIGTPSFCNWLTMRRVCKQSKFLADTAATKLTEFIGTWFMRTTAGGSPWLRPTIDECFKLRDAIVTHGFSYCDVLHEFEYANIELGHTSCMWTSIWPFMRLRTNVSPASNPNPSFKPINFHAPEPKLEGPSAGTHATRCSKRLAAKRSCAEAAVVSDDAPFARIGMKIQVPGDWSEDPHRTWVCCDLCQKWRRLPDSDPALLPERWTCVTHPWGVSCEDAEDLMDEDEWAI